MGLLDNTQQPQQQMGGLLGGQPQAMPPQGMPPQGSGNVMSPDQAKQMAMELMQSPTKETGMKIISELSSSNSPQIKSVINFIQSNLNNPVALKHVAQSVLSGAQ